MHLFGENEQVRQGANIGTGAAYDWALRAVNQHNITNVVVMGFSWGGGATFNLLDRINRDLGNAQPPFVRRFHVPFTAYVDAIVHGRTAAQVNRPPVSRFHVNYYQQVDRFDNPIRGAAVPGSNVDRDVNNPRINAARELVYTTIDDDLNVQDELRRQLSGQANQR